MNILLVGLNGRMGKKVVDASHDNFKIVAGVDKSLQIESGDIINKYIKFSDIENYIIDKIDVVLDFAVPEVLKDELLFCIKNKKPLVICSTGHNEQDLNLIKAASRAIPIFKTSNTSFGVALINKIIKDNVLAFANYDLFVLEKHHKNKKDAPSGSAKTIIENLEVAGNRVEYASVRGGSVVGEHEIMLLGDGEQISIKHTAESRDLFAKSALKICDFISKQKIKKLYGMEDIIK